MNIGNVGDLITKVKEQINVTDNDVDITATAEPEIKSDIINTESVKKKKNTKKKDK